MKTEINVQTGAISQVPLTPEEQAYNEAERAREAAENTPDALADKRITNFDRLMFEINFDQENRVRALEGKAAITRLQYRNALINVYKGL